MCAKRYAVAVRDLQILLIIGMNTMVILGYTHKNIHTHILKYYYSGHESNILPRTRPLNFLLLIDYSW